MPKTSRRPMELLPIRVPRPMLDEVEAEAGRDEVGNSEVVRRALRYYFDRGATRAPDTSKVDT